MVGRAGPARRRITHKRRRRGEPSPRDAEGSGRQPPRPTNDTNRKRFLAISL